MQSLNTFKRTIQNHHKNKNQIMKNMILNLTKERISSLSEDELKELIEGEKVKDPQIEEALLLEFTRKSSARLCKKFSINNRLKIEE